MAHPPGGAREELSTLTCLPPMASLCHGVTSLLTVPSLQNVQGACELLSSSQIVSVCCFIAARSYAVVVFSEQIEMVYELCLFNNLTLHCRPAASGRIFVFFVNYS